MLDSRNPQFSYSLLQKKIVAGLLSIALVLSASCQESETELSESSTSSVSAAASTEAVSATQAVSVTEEVSVPVEENEYFEVVSKDYSDGVLTFTLKNISSRLLNYGNPTRVEELVDGEWREVSTNVGYTMERLQSSPLLEITVELPLTLWQPSPDADTFRMALPVEVGEGIDVMIPFERSDLVE